MKVYVLDTSAIINYLNRYYAPGLQYYTTNSVLSEIKSTLSQLRLEYSLSKGELRIHDPSPEILKEVLENAKRTGDFFKLSSTDIEVVALAFELKKYGHDVVIVTDDYAIMNLSLRLKIPFKPALMSPISEYREVTLMCPVCKYKAKLSLNENTHIIPTCPRCGTELKLIIRKRRRLNS